MMAGPAPAFVRRLYGSPPVPPVPLPAFVRYLYGNLPVPPVPLPAFVRHCTAPPDQSPYKTGDPHTGHQARALRRALHSRRLLSEGRAELSASITDEAYVEASDIAHSRSAGVWGDMPQ
jgi:hypothetical protein